MRTYHKHTFITQPIATEQTTNRASTFEKDVQIHKKTVHVPLSFYFFTFIWHVAISFDITENILLTHLAGLGGSLGPDVVPYKLHPSNDVLGLLGRVDRGRGSTANGLAALGYLIPARLPELLQPLYWKQSDNTLQYCKETVSYWTQWH